MSTPWAMVFEGPGRPLVRRDFPWPQLRAREALVRITACTLCGSDLHSFEGRRATPCPTILGHEMLGHLEALGDPPPTDLLGEPLQLGERVLWSLAVGCGHCFFCEHDLPQKCQRLVKYGHERLSDQHALNGGLATHTHLLAGTAIVRVPQEIPDEVACPASCATATIGCALRHAGELNGRVLLIQGAGMLGLTAAAFAQVAGARAVVVNDPDAGRCERARLFGASHAVPTADLSATIHALTEGRGADVLLELSGAPEAFELGLPLLRIGGCCVLVGAVFPSRPVALSLETLVRRQCTLHGVHNYRPDDLHRAVQFLLHGSQQFPFEQLLSSPFALAQAQEAFAHAHAVRCPRVLVCPGEIR